jgi:hypothetical protein
MAGQRRGELRDRGGQLVRGEPLPLLEQLLSQPPEAVHVTAEQCRISEPGELTRG